MHGVRKPGFVLAAATMLLASANASAHILVTDPPARVNHDDTKVSPCGEALPWGEGGVATFAPGEQITLQWDETILHPGYYRVAVSTMGDASLTMPSEADLDTFKAFYNSGSGSLPETIEHPTGMEVDGLLLYYDYYAPHGMSECAGTNSGGTCSYEVTLTLPDSCDECTIQVVQAMAESFRTYGVNAHYYHCVDFTIEGDAAGTTGDSSTNPSSGGTDTSTSIDTTSGTPSNPSTGATGTTTGGNEAGTETAPMPTTGSTTGSTTAVPPPAGPTTPPSVGPTEAPSPSSTPPQPPPASTAPGATVAPNAPPVAGSASGLTEMAGGGGNQASGGCSLSRHAPHRGLLLGGLLLAAGLLTRRRHHS